MGTSSCAGRQSRNLQVAFNDNWIKATGEVLNGEAYFPATAVAGEMDAHMFIACPPAAARACT